MDDKGAVDLDPCDWAAASEPTETFDLGEALRLPWNTKNDAGATVELEDFFGSCYGNCMDLESPNEICGGGEDDDEPHGSWHAEEGRCECAEGWFGFQCDLEKPCPLLLVDERGSGFIGTREFFSEYKALQHPDGSIAIVYDKPAYVTTKEHEVDGSRDIIVYTGRRWVMASSNSFEMATGSMHDLARYLSHEFHAHCSAYSALFISDPVDIGTPDDGATPVNLRWHMAGTDLGPSSRGVPPVDTSQPSQDATLLCQLCDNDSNPCYYDGICSVARTCECLVGVKGVLCQIPPTGNGLCDTFFNAPEFAFDGGDCCETTCRSSGEYECGKDKTGVFNVGYALCADPDQLTMRNARWIAGGDPLLGDSNLAAMGSSVAVTLGGTVMAVAEPGIKTVRVFDRVGSSWVFRDSFEVVSDEYKPLTYREISVAISAPRNAISGPNKKLPVVVAVATPRNVQVVQWSNTLATWEDISSLEIIFWHALDFIDGSVPRVGLFDEGKILAVFEHNNFWGRARLLKRNSWKNEHDGNWAVFNFTEDENRGLVDFSIAEDGSRFVAAAAGSVIVHELVGSAFEEKSRVDLPGKNPVAVKLSANGRFLAVLGNKFVYDSKGGYHSNSEGKVWVFENTPQSRSSSRVLK